MGNDTSDPVNNLTRMWMEMAANAMQAWQPLTGPTASPELFRKGRAEIMQAWSDWCEQIMRSSAFLDVQKQCLDGNLTIRKHFRANVRRMQRELQLAGREDIDGLVAAVQRAQRRILNQLEDTSERLGTLEAKIDCLNERLDRILDGEEAGARHSAADNGTGGKKNRRINPKN